MRQLKIFNSLNDLCTDIQPTDRAKVNSDWADSAVENRLQQGDISWYGGLTYDEAFHLCANGWAEGAAKIKAAGQIKGRGTAVDTAFIEPSVVGFMPNVPAYLRGLPNSMFNLYNEPIIKPIVNIAVQCGVKYSTTADEMAEAANKIACIIARIEETGIRTNLYSAYIADPGGKKEKPWGVLCKIKDAGQALNLLNVAFPLTHPAFSRVVCFRAQEVHCPWYKWSRGCTLAPANLSKFLQENCAIKFNIVWQLDDVVSRTITDLCCEVNNVLK